MPSIYTRSTRPLHVSDSQVQRFRESGYTRVPGFFSAELAGVLRRISDRLSRRAGSIIKSCAAKDIPLSAHAQENALDLIVVPEATSPAKVCRYEFMLGSDSEFRGFIEQYVQAAVSALVGEETVPFKDKTNEKLPGGGAFRPHQDMAAYDHFGPRYHATAYLTIDSSTLANGCVEFASNFDDLAATNPALVSCTIDNRPVLHYNEGDMDHGDIRGDIADQLRWRPIKTCPLDLVVFDSFIPHFSRPNRSGNPRRGIFVTFNRTSEGLWYERYYAEKRLHYDDPKFHVGTPTLHRTSRACSTAIDGSSAIDA